MQTEPLQKTSRWTLIRDVGVFQVKLLFDGLRDVLLVPVSLVAGLVGLIGRGASPGTQFYDLLRLARRSERWINLFGAASRVHGPPGDDERLAGEDIDEFVARIESFVVDEYRRGGVTAQAKANVDRALEAIRRRAARRREP